MGTDNNNNNKASSICPPKMIGFGYNYYHALGPHQQTLQVHTRTPPPVAAVDEEEHDNSNSTTSTITGHIFPGPQERQHQNIQIHQVACTHAATLWLQSNDRFSSTSTKHDVYWQGTMHGHVAPTPTMLKIPFPVPCVELAAGRHFCLGKLQGGVAVVSWGAGHFGQLGQGTTTNHNENTEQQQHVAYRSTPQVIPGLLPPAVGGSPIKSIAAGTWHGMAVTESGSLFCWGGNRTSQCAVTSGTKKSVPPTVWTPTKVDGLPPSIVQVAGGRGHSLAVDGSRGHVYAWGCGHAGQLGTGVVTSARKHAHGISTPKLVSSLQKVHIHQVAAGDFHSLARTGGGRVFGWGQGLEGQLGVGTLQSLVHPKPLFVSDLDFVAVEASVAHKRQHQHHQHGESSESSCAESSSSSSSSSININPLPNLPKIVDISARGYGSAALSSCGHVYTWGCNDAHQLGLPHSGNDLPMASTEGGFLNEPKSKLRIADYCTLDSNHNVPIPRRIDVVNVHDNDNTTSTENTDMLRIRSIAMGPAHLWCVLDSHSHPPVSSSKNNNKHSIGYTLYEYQVQAWEEKRRRQRRKKEQAQEQQPMEWKRTSSPTKDADTDADIEQQWSCMVPTTTTTTTTVEDPQHASFRSLPEAAAAGAATTTAVDAPKSAPNTPTKQSRSSNHKRFRPIKALSKRLNSFGGGRKHSSSDNSMSLKTK